MIGLCVAWASMMVVSMIPKERYGVYLGIINMMIVVPMLIESVTFGFIYENFPGDDPTNAMMFSGAAVAMTWIRPPKRQSPVVPLTFRQIMGYDRILAGSDGSPSSLQAVDRAAAAAVAPEATMVVVCAYNPLPGRDQAVLSNVVAPVRKEVRGESAAREALQESVNRINTDRVRHLETRLVEGDPANALVDAVDDANRDLIVIGNRGLGALPGQLLGSVPTQVSQLATCDVLIVQTTPEAGDRPEPPA